MVKQKRLSNVEANIEQRLSEGRGQGRGVNYKLWLSVQSVGSAGVSSRIRGWKTQRVHEFLSLQELYYFYVLEWSRPVSDIREQYPLLPLSETQDLAKMCGIRHPTRLGSSEPVVMTTDFVVTVNQSIGVVEIARTVKPSQMLSKQRTLEKLEIERLYWQRRGVSWGIVTEREIPLILAKNVEWLHPFHACEGLGVSASELRRITRVLTQGVALGSASLAENEG